MGNKLTVLPWDGDSGYGSTRRIADAGLFHWLGAALKKDVRNCRDLQLMDCCFFMD